MEKRHTCNPEISALASEALRVTRTFNYTLFARPDPISDWGFTRESFLGSADWVFTEEGIASPEVAGPAFELVERIRDSQRLCNVNLSAVSRKNVVGQTDMVAIIKIVEEFVAKVSELGVVLDVEARFLGYNDFYPEETDRLNRYTGR